MTFYKQSYINIHMKKIIMVERLGLEINRNDVKYPAGSERNIYIMHKKIAL